MMQRVFMLFADQLQRGTKRPADKELRGHTVNCGEQSEMEVLEGTVDLCVRTVSLHIRTVGQCVLKLD